MARHVAFLRGMNVGGRRITNVELCEAFASLGFPSPHAFLASGNVVFDDGGASSAALQRRIEKGLEEALGYPVPTYLRTADELRSIAAAEPFEPDLLEASAGKLQVALLSKAPSAAAKRRALARGSEADRLVLEGRELYWLPSGGVLESELDVAALESELGAWTARTHRTLQRLAAKYFAD